MRIGIDARFLGPEGTGLGRYIEEIIDELQDLDQENEYVIFLRKDNFDLFKPKNKKFTKVLADAHWYTVKEQFVMPRVIKAAKVDLMHFGHFNIPVFSRTKFIVTIHDLIKSDYASKSATTRAAIVYTTKHYLYKWVIKRAAKKSKRIITPSHFVKKKVVDQLGVLDDKVVVTHEAADEKFFEWGKKEISEAKKKEVLEKYDITQPFLIYVGNSYPYKNLDRLLNALKQGKSNVNLINPCARSIFYNRLRAKVKVMNLDKRVSLPGFVPDEDLAVLYRMATAYVFPSLSEGFGIPPLEAMATGLPVICSNVSSIPEVCGDAALYFDPLSTKDIKKKIELMLKRDDLKRGYQKKGLIQAKKFSWRKTARETLKVYKKALKR